MSIWKNPLQEWTIPPIPNDAEREANSENAWRDAVERKDHLRGETRLREAATLARSLIFADAPRAAMCVLEWGLNEEEPSL